MSESRQSIVGQRANLSLADELRRSRERFLAALDRIPECARDVREGQGAWSILDCVEHVCTAEELMAASLKKRRATEAEPDLQRDVQIRLIALDRARKITVPDRAKPTGRYGSLAEAVNAFCNARERNIALIESFEDDLRKSTCLHAMGVFDGHQFVEIMALHPERHAMQIKEIKNSAAYRTALQTEGLA